MTEAYSPRSLAEAVALLAQQPSALPIAGGTDSMVAESEHRADLPSVLDLMRVEELRGIREIDGGLEIGATTTFSEIQAAATVRERLPALVDAAASVGGWQIQNRATVGGNLANASPAGDSLPVLLALDATIVAVSSAGRREIPYSEFHLGYRQTALEPGELIGWVRIPNPAAGSRQFFRKVGTREAQAISKVVVALTGRVAAGRIAELRLAAGSVAATPVRFGAVEEALVGELATSEAADRGGRLAAASVEPIDDVRSTAEYRRFALERVVRRLLLGLVAG